MQTPDDFTSTTDELVANNARFAVSFSEAELRGTPLRRLAIVACMDSRLDLLELFGLGHGEAHIIRNAGGVITDDVVRSLCMSQRLLGTREVVLVHHTDCGLQKVDPVAFEAELEADTGMKPTWAVESFTDPYVDVRQSMRRLAVNPFLPHRDHVRGFVYDVSDGLLREVTDDDAPGGADAVDDDARRRGGPHSQG